MFNFLKKKVGIIGFGNMGSALAERARHRYLISVFDKDKSKIQYLSGIQATNSIADLVSKVDAVVLAVKPQDFDAVLDELKGKADDKLVISIAAGIATKYIEKTLGMIRVIRVMPNIGAIVGQGVSFICKGGFAKTQDLKLSVKLFNSVGRSFIFSEDLMNAATAVGGSGPGFWGYLFDKRPTNEWDEYKSNYFIPELTSAAISVGFDKKTAKSTAYFLTVASISAAEALHITPAELTKKVASKGGTTEAGLEVLGKGGSLTDAVQAAYRRAEELTKRR